MPPRIRTLARALRLLKERPTDKMVFSPLELRRPGPLSAADLQAAASELDAPLPEEYRLLLETYGPISIEERKDIARMDLLSPDQAMAARAGLKAFLREFKGWMGEHLPHPDVVDAPESALLPVLTDVDSNGHTGWTFYRLGDDTLYECHPKVPLEALEDGSLEEQVVSMVCAFAGWDPLRGTWYPR